MDWIADRTVSFFVDNFPSWKVILIGGPPSLLWSYICLHFAGYLKKHRGLKTAYTRKIFHILIFSSVIAIQCIWGTPIVCLFGSMCSLIIFYSTFRGAGNLLYEAIARESDAPHRTHYIIIPYFTTLVGGLVSNILFGSVAIVGYLVTGLGDAVGEPIGFRFGKYTYKVPSLTSVEATRSLEGSAAVLIMCILTLSVGVVLSPQLEFTTCSFLIIPLLGSACTFTEAFSPRGWDNITMQIIPTYLAMLFF